MFPQIKHISDLLPFIEQNPQFRVAPQPNGMTVICYMLQDEDTFVGENEMYAKECRGITFRADGSVASRTLHKFQNVGENDYTQPYMIPWDRIVRIMDKRDGSMITPVMLDDGTIVCKTKKTFTSKEAEAATEFLHQDPARVQWCADLLLAGFTPTFEWTSPRFPIVLTYDKDELTLLQIRDNELGTYKTSWTDAQIAACPFPIVQNIIDEFKNAPYMEMGCFADDIVNWDYDERGLKHAAETRTGVEGWIVQADDGQMWKVKTKWYCDLHHSVTFTRWRDVARVVLADQSDDLKAAFAMTGRSIEPILYVERQIKQTIEPVRDMVQHYAATGRETGMTPKDMALNFKDHAQFGLIMNAFRGKEINWMEWYEKTFLDTWSLEVIVDHIAEEAV